MRGREREGGGVIQDKAVKQAIEQQKKRKGDAYF